MAIVHSDGLPGETRYFQSEKLFQEAVAAFDFDADPFVGFLLRLSDARTGHYRISRNAKVNRKPIKAAEIAIEEGRYDEADAIYRKIRGAKGLGYGEKVISGRQGFKVRKIVQEARGGWVDVMPTENAYEAETWWSVLATQKDGRAHMKARDIIALNCRCLVGMPSMRRPFTSRRMTSSRLDGSSGGDCPPCLRTLRICNSCFKICNCMLGVGVVYYAASEVFSPVYSNHK